MNTSAQKSSERHLWFSDDIEKSAHVHLLNSDHYLYDEIHASVDQIVDASNPLGNIDEAHCRALLESFRNYNENYAHRMMTVYFSTRVDPKGATYATAVRSVDGMKMLKYGYRMVIIDACHCRRSMQMIRDENGKE